MHDATTVRLIGRVTGCHAAGVVVAEAATGLEAIEMARTRILEELPVAVRTVTNGGAVLAPSTPGARSRITRSG